MTIETIEVDSNTPCGDSCCCWMPPHKFRAHGVDRTSNLVFELRGSRLPYEPLYEFGTGKCLHLDFNVKAECVEGKYVIRVLGRCSAWPDPYCAEFPRNTKQVFCDYEKCLWPPEKQVRRQGCRCTLYYGLRKPWWGTYNMDAFTRDPLTKSILFNAMKDPKETRVKEVVVGLLLRRKWFLLKVPICNEVCKHLPPVNA